MFAILVPTGFIPGPRSPRQDLSYQTSIWEPVPRRPQRQLTSITILGQAIHLGAPGHFHCSSASSSLHLKDVVIFAKNFQAIF